ncbi:MAG: hypothetical protein KKC20_06430, partial [Proteobacteria bacterium]|nr:hypothetical protein [Pseudomonadota bacterium]
FDTVLKYIVNILILYIIIFIVRELILQLYTHEHLVNNTLVGFGRLLLCLGVIRSMALLISPEGEKRIN